MTSVRDISRELLANEARNLHAIQSTAKAMMTRVIDRLEHYPDARTKLQAHLGDKDNEMSRLETILADLGEGLSGAKDTVASAMGGMTGLLTKGLDDDILKSSMITYGLASYEIAAYESMIVLADKADQPDAVPLLEECLEEERAMAKWLHDHLAPTVEQYVELRSREGAVAAH